MHPDLSSLGQYGFSDDAHQFGRSVEFFRELAALNIAAAWGEVDAHVLAVHGEFDWVSGEADHALIARVVSARRPGTASWITLERSDHGYQSYDTLEASFVDRRTGPFNPQIVRTCVEWMRVTGR